MKLYFVPVFRVEFWTENNHIGSKASKSWNWQFLALEVILDSQVSYLISDYLVSAVYNKPSASWNLTVEVQNQEYIRMDNTIFLWYYAHQLFYKTSASDALE